MPPEAPALLLLEPPPRWQRSIIPYADQSELDSLLSEDTPGDPPGWAHGALLVDGTCRVFRLDRHGVSYELKELPEAVSDDDLRRKMEQNLNALGVPPDGYRSAVHELAGPDLVAETARQATALPDMRGGLRAIGCVGVALALLLAVAAPVALIAWLLG